VTDEFVPGADLARQKKGVRMKLAEKQRPTNECALRPLRGKTLRVMIRWRFVSE
jgi:hypothetical protein